MSSEKSLYDKGKEVRIAVLGEAHVQRSLAARQSEFAKPLQDFTTEYCWGKVWSRPELDRRSRSLVSKYCYFTAHIPSLMCFVLCFGLLIGGILLQISGS